MGHKTRHSDSSLFDVICDVCGATDSDGALDDPCPGSHQSKSSENRLRLQKSDVNSIYYDVVGSKDRIQVRIQVLAEYGKDRERIERQIVDAVNSLKPQMAENRNDPNSFLSIQSNDELRVLVELLCHTTGYPGFESRIARLKEEVLSKWETNLKNINR